MKPSELLTKFEAYLLTERRVAENTFGAYKRDTAQFITFVEKHKIKLERISKKQLQDFLRYLYGLKLSARSVSRKISALKLFFFYLNRQFGWKNIAEELLFPKIEKKLPQYLSEDEIKQILTSADQDTSEIGIRNKVMLFLMYASGMRVSELTKLKVSDIHFDTGFISVDGKGGKQRMIPVPQRMLSMIKEYLETVYHSLIHSRSTVRESEHLFPVKYGNRIKPISRQSFWGIIKRICKKAGIKRSVFPHQLRHSLATHMLKNGADPRSLQILLGHESISTVQIYTHVETSHLRKIYDKKHPRS